MGIVCMNESRAPVQLELSVERAARCTTAGWSSMLVTYSASA